MTEIIVRQPTSQVTVGPGSGAPGPAGPPGPGVPAGGSDGDVVVKDGTDPYAFEVVGKGTFVQGAASLIRGLLPEFDIRDYGAVGGGVDDSAAINLAITTAAVAGGVVVFPQGTWIGKDLAVKTNVIYRGCGTGTVIKLANSANTDLFVSDSFSSLTGGTTTGGPTGFRFENVILDGNRANNTSGWPLRIYGSNFTVHNVHVRDGKSGGVWSQWGSGGTNMESHWSNFKVFNSEGDVFVFNGPHDSLFNNGSVFNDSTQPSTAGNLLVVDGQSGGSQFVNIHVWGNCSRAVDVQSEVYFSNCQAEGATVANLRFRSNFGQWVGGHIFGTTTGTEIGVEFGVAAVTSSKGCYVNTKFSRFGAGSFPIKWTNSAGHNVVVGQIGANVTAAALYTGTPNTTVGTEDRMDVRSSSPTALATSWAVPKLQSKRLWVPATDLEIVGGTPALTVVQSTPVWLFDAAAVETVGTQIELPAWWDTCDVYFWWANAGAGAGDVVWAFRYDFIAAGQTLGTYSSMFKQATAGAQDVVVALPQDGDLTNVANQPMLVRVERTANNASDTLANDAELIGIEFVHLT